MYNYEEQLANLCDMRKAIINGLSLMGLTAQQIYDRLRLPYTESAQQHIADATAHYDVVSKCMSQCEELKYPPDSDVIVYYFDSEYIEHRLSQSVDTLGIASFDGFVHQRLQDNRDDFVHANYQFLPFVLTELQSQEAGDVD